MFKKYVVYSIVFAMIFSYILPGNVFAQDNNSQEVLNEELKNQEILELIESTQKVTEINFVEDNTIVEEVFSEELSEVVDITGIETEDSIAVQTEIHADELNSEGTLLFDKDSNELVIDVSTEDENGEQINETYKMFLNSLTDEEINFTLINMETGEVIEVHSLEAQAAILPAVISFLARFGLNWIIKKFGKKTLEKAVKDVTKKMAKKSLGKGSTGRTKPKDLVEELFMDYVLDNPLHEAKELNIKLTDSRWHHKDGWVKMERKLKTKEGRSVVIHFVYNKKTKKFDDFKFK